MNVFVRNHLKEVCHQKNMTIKELAERAEISRWMLSRADMNLRLENIAKVLAVLNCKFEDVFEIVILNDL